MRIDDLFEGNIIQFPVRVQAEPQPVQRHGDINHDVVTALKAQLGK